MKFTGLLFAILAFNLSFAQMTELEVRQMVKTASEQELLITSSQMMQDNYLYQAEIVIDKLIQLKPESANYNYRKGYVVLMNSTDFQKAIPFLEKAVKNVRQNYDMYSTKEEAAPPDAFYHLAKCYHYNEQLVEAKTNYELFIAQTRSKSELIALSELGLKQIEVAKNEMERPKSAIVQNVGPEINTSGPEYSSVVSLDGASLYFTARVGWEDGSTDDLRNPVNNQYPEDIFVSYQDFDGKWTTPARLDLCEFDLNEATIGVSADERRIYIYKDASGGGDIYTSDFKNNKFEEIAGLDFTDVNTPNWETHCTMTPDGQNFYFASERPGGFGGRDIYRIVKLPNGEWSKAQNLGPTINTPYDEDAPFIDVNNKTLYYASNGPRSMGGFDIFLTIRDENNIWSDPVNLGYPINSTGDDIYYTTTIDGLKGYLTSFRKGGYGEKDIYEIENDYLGSKPISTIRGTFVMNDGSEVGDNIEVFLVCTNCENADVQKINPRIKNGSYFAALQRCKDYQLQYFVNGVLEYTEDFVTICNGENEEITKEHVVGPYDLAGSVADANTLAFLSGSTVEIVDAATNSKLASYNTDEAGQFTGNLLEGKKYGEKISWIVRVKKDNYLTQTFVVDTTLGVFKTLRLDYLLSKKDVGTDIGEVLKINPIYFDLDKSEIRPDAAIELDKIVAIMNENPDIRIELGSHTDCRASKSYNLALSDRRAKASAAYIQARIKDSKRIYGKGYGESQLVNDCECEGTVVADCSEEEHQANRRTEFKIVKK
jgi:outer membrane protein OmpA-like peptidoglycan-associated protein